MRSRTRSWRPHPSNKTALAGLVLSLVAGCGASEPAGSETAADPTSPANGSGDIVPADPDALGIDTVSWPTSHEDAGVLLRELPNEVAGLPRTSTGGEAPASAATATYGRYELVLYVTASTKEVPDPKATLSASFGLGMVGKPTTYTGTATPGWKRLVPGVGTGRDGELWWFTCEVGGVEGGGPAPGFALGWVSGELAWLLTAPDRAAGRALVTELQRGLRS